MNVFLTVTCIDIDICCITVTVLIPDRDKPYIGQPSACGNKLTTCENYMCYGIGKYLI